ncbi:flagellar hook-length control protein FliK [Priestia megaterium]
MPQLSIDLGKVKLDHQQSSDLVNELQKIWSKASLSAEERRSKLFVTLLPKQLGTISIEVRQQDHKTTAQVVVSSAKTKELLDANLLDYDKLSRLSMYPLIKLVWTLFIQLQKVL